MQSLQCPHCNVPFRRREHLDRHVLRHSGAKPFPCDICPRQFSRRDALQRHLSTHDASFDYERAPDRQVGKSQRKHACANCARAKQRCPGGNPCARCAEKDAPCEYRNRTPPAMSPPPSQTSVVDEGPFAMSHLPTPLDAYNEVTAQDANHEVPDSLTWPSQDWLFSNALAWMPDCPLSGDSFNELDFLSDWTQPPAHAPNVSGIGSPRPNHPRNFVTTAPTRNVPSTAEATGQHTSTSRVLPDMDAKHAGVVLADLLGHVSSIPLAPLARVADHFQTQYRTSEPFFDPTTFQSFVDLYYEYFADYFPFLHVSKVETDDVHWILLLGVAAIGAHYSSLQDSISCAVILQDLFLRAVEHNYPRFPSVEDLTWAQIILLRDICMLFNGGKILQITRQFEKHKLLTFCHALTHADAARAFATPDSEAPKHPGQQQDWSGWIADESRLRLLHGAYSLECLQLAYHDVRPGVQLEDLTNSMPCHDDLWRCRTETEWERLAAERPDLLPTHNDRTSSSANWDAIETGGYRDRLLFVYLYAEERLTLDRLYSTPLRRILFPHASFTPRQQQWADTPSFATIEDPRALMSCMRASAGEEMKRLDARGQSMTSSYAAHASHQDVLYPLLFLLRDMPLRMVLASSGWLANDAQTGRASSELRTWMTRQQETARRALQRAATIFSILREKRAFGPYDAHALLAAALYIWAFDRQCPPGSQHPRGPGGEEDPRPVTLRLERPTDARANEHWIMGRAPAGICIPGVGILDGGDSQTRVLQELVRILMTRTEWSGVCQVIGKAALQLLNKRRPQFEEDIMSKTGLDVDSNAESRENE